MTYDQAKALRAGAVLDDGAIVLGHKHWNDIERVGLSVMRPDGVIEARHFDREES